MNYLELIELLLGPKVLYLLSETNLIIYLLSGYFLVNFPHPNNSQIFPNTLHTIFSTIVTIAGVDVLTKKYRLEGK